MADATRYDAVVIGAGHNGLTAACALAKRGKRVIVVETRDIVGGLCAGEEFHSGYHHAGLLHDTTGVRAGVVDALRLHEHGLDLGPVPPVFVPTEGDGLLLSHNPDDAAQQISSVSERDADSYREFHAFVSRVRRVVAPVLNEIPPDLIGPDGPGLPALTKLAFQGLAVRRLGKRDMMELMRVPPMCVADWLNEWFETDAIKVALSSRAITGTWCGPWSPGTAANLLMWACTADRSVVGGPAALIASLERAARHLGVEIRTGAAVTGIRVSGGNATGVDVDGGDRVDASAVMSSCDPRTTLLGLLPTNALSYGVERRTRQFRMRGTTAKVHLALNRSLPIDASVEHVITGSSLDGQERAFDAVKYRRFSEHPVLDISVTNVARPERAPSGHAAVSILVNFAPYHFDGGWTDEARAGLGDTVVAELDRTFPGTAATIVGREVLTPADIEARYGLTEGHVHHGEHALDQLLARPTIDAARYRTPVGRLYLCGGGSHPGGGVTCAPGALAAREVD